MDKLTNSPFLSRDSMARRQCVEIEKSGRFCTCRSCFLDWWNGLTLQWRDRIAMWAYYIEKEVPMLSSVTPYESDPKVAKTANNYGEVFDNERVGNWVDNLLNAPDSSVHTAQEIDSDKWDGHGVQLDTDEINLYCDRLQRAVAEVGRTIEGCFAIQSIHGQCDTVEPSRNNDVFQVIFDERGPGHFILVEWTPTDKVVIVYDSIIPDDLYADITLTPTVLKQLTFLFSNLYPIGIIHIRIERNIEAQEDGWSCGLRCIALFTLRALQLPATRRHLNLRKISLLMRAINSQQNPKWDDFLAIKDCCTDFSNSVDDKKPLLFDYNWKDVDDIHSDSTNSKKSDEETYDN